MTLLLFLVGYFIGGVIVAKISYKKLQTFLAEEDFLMTTLCFWPIIVLFIIYVLLEKWIKK